MRKRTQQENMLGGRWMEWQFSWRTERWEDSSIYQPLIGQSVLKAFQGIRLNHGTKLTRISPIILAWLGSMWCNPNILRISRPANACSVKPHGLWASPRRPVCTQGISSVSALVCIQNVQGTWWVHRALAPLASLYVTYLIFVNFGALPHFLGL